MKRFLIILLIVLILFNSVYVPEVYAVGNMIINNPFNRQLIATMIIASGMVFTSTKQLEDSVTSFIDMWNDHETGWTMPTPKEPQGPNTWEAIVYSSIAAGSLVYDITTGTFKQLLELTEDFVDFVKQFVDENYHAGEIIEEGYVSNSEGPFGLDIGTSRKIYWKDIGYAHFSVYRNQDNDVVVSFYVSNGTDSYQGTIERYRSHGYLTNVGSTLYFTQCYGTGSGEMRLGPGIPFIYCDTSIFENSVDETLGYGNPDIVDNPDYQYKHNETGTPTIVIPIQSPEADESGYFVPSEDLDDLVDIGAADIANESTDGIIIPAPTPTPSPEPVPYPELPGDDIATDEDYDNPNKRALYQLKFPFSLPWDIKAVFQLLNAPAKAPRFEIDIIPAGLKDKIGITGETEFIFDMEEFELIGQVTRFFSFIGFCLTLIYITRNIIKS